MDSQSSRTKGRDLYVKIASIVSVDRERNEKEKNHP